MEDTQTPPTGEQVEMTAPTSLSDVFASPSGEPAHIDEAGAAVATPELGDAPPTPEPAPAPAPTTPAPPAAQAGDPAKPEAEGPRWYREHMAKVARERAAEKAELERLRSAAPVQPRPAPQALPDPLEDPQAYAHALQGQFRNEFQAFQLETTLKLSERFARQQHGSENFEECRAWLSTKPDIEAWAIQQPDPWTAAFTQYQRERLAEEIGDDPKAYEQRLREKILSEIEAANAAPAASSTPPTMRAAPPPSASAARSAAPRDGAGRSTGPTPIGEIFKGRA